MLGIPSKVPELTVSKTDAAVGREPLCYEATGRKSQAAANNTRAETYFFLMN